MAKIQNTPRRLKSLTSEDVLSIKDANGNYLVVTKQEVDYTIRQMVRNEMDFFTDEAIKGRKKECEEMIRVKTEAIERSIYAMITFKFDKLAEKVCDLLITRKFNEEVERKVNLKLAQMKTK